MDSWLYDDSALIETWKEQTKEVLSRERGVIKKSKSGITKVCFTTGP